MSCFAGGVQVPRGEKMQQVSKKEVFLHKLAAAFPDEKLREAAMAILRQYGMEKHERESERVWLAVLKISGNDLAQIRRNTALAKQDFRDVLVAAEYPNQGRIGPMPAGREKRELIEKDRLQYEKWLSDK
jgi:hypothetical protein